MANKAGIDDLYYSIQQNGAVNPEDELKKLIEVNVKPYLSSKQVNEILSWVNIRLMDNRGDVATKEIIFNDKTIHALSTLPDTEFQRWVRIFENNGARGFKRELKGLVAEKRRKIDLPFTGPVGLGDAFPTDNDFPTEAEGFQIPKGWRIEKGGVFQEKEHDGGVKVSEVTYFPIFIILRMVPLETNIEGGELLELALKLDNRWKRVRVFRRDLAEARKMVAALTEARVPITAVNAGDLVKFFGDYEKVNRDKIPVISFPESMGWKGEGRAFVLGNEVLGQKQGIVFHCKDADVGMLISGINTSGTPEGWQKNTKTATQNRPELVFNISGGAAPPLLKILGCSNFGIDKPGRSSRGKTAGDKIALSIYGNPSILLRSANWTKYAVENYAYAFCDLPVILDDSHAIPQTGDIVYLIINGIGRGRGSKGGGNQQTKVWRTVMLTSGEAPLEMAAAWTGLRARIITLRNVWGKATGAEVRTAVAGACENFGHAGPELIKYLLKHKGSWPTFREKYRKLVNQLAEECKGIEVAERRCEYVAAVSLTAGLLDSLFELGWDCKKILTDGKMPELFGELFGKVTMTNSNYTTGQAGLEVVRDWILSNKANFEGGGADTRIQRCFGRWQEEQYIAVYGSFVRQELRNHGINDHAVIDELTEKGICVRKSVRLIREGTPRVMLVFNWQRLMADENGGLEDLNVTDPEDGDTP